MSTVPGKIVEEYDSPTQSYKSRGSRMALVQFGEISRPVALDLLPDAHVGDWVRIHAGFAVQRVTEAEADAAYAAIDLEEVACAIEQDLEADENSPDAQRRQKQH